MPYYEYETEDGERVDHFVEMANATPIGDTIKVDGRKLTRLCSTERLSIAVDNTRFECWSQELWAPGAPRYDTEGKPCFVNKREATEFAKLNGGTYGEI